MNSKLGLGGEPKDQYIIVDLGAGKNTIDEIKVSYFKKVWPTNYTVEVSADKNTWETVKTIERNSSNDLNVVDDFKLEEAKNARYVRLSFPKDGLNTNAAGSSVSITELEVYGTKENVELDTTALEQQIAATEEIIKNAEAEPNKYDSATVEALKTALEAAKAVVNKPESQEQLDKAVEDLKAAQAGLKELNLDELKAALQKAEEILTEENCYTPESYEAFKAVYEKVKALLGKPMTQQQADDAKAELEAAQGQLEKVGKEGWVQTENGWEYYENGQKVTGWLYTGNHWYYMNDNGIMVTGWAAVDGHWYYMDQWGAMCTGWVAADGHWYYMDQWGAMCTGWVAVDGHWYYMDQWGAMRTGWALVGDDWYYLNADGTMASNQWIGGYYVDASGKMV